jgi:hypothetical protein
VTPDDPTYIPYAGFRCAADQVLENVVTATPTAVTDPSLLYQDDFTNPTSGWAVTSFDNYLVGYHEPEWYNIEISAPNYKLTVFEPEQYNFTDATIEATILTDSTKTAAEGDFRYGVAFRRSGDQYYAFVISPRAKKWYVLKSNTNVLATLLEGSEPGIHDLDVDNLLRVDAEGSNFLFHINDQFVAEVTDQDYTSGEVGFYVENFDNSNTHVHFDWISVREVKFSMMCTISDGGTVYVRSGPSQTFPQIGVLSGGDTVQALGISSNQWIQIVVEGSDEPGWVSFFEGFMTCTPSVDLFPIVSP